MDKRERENVTAVKWTRERENVTVSNGQERERECHSGQMDKRERENITVVKWTRERENVTAIKWTRERERECHSGQMDILSLIERERMSQ